MVFKKLKKKGKEHQQIKAALTLALEMNII
jgi:hypothetical protein